MFGECARSSPRRKRRGLHSVIVLGRTADWLLGTHLGLRDDPDIAYHQITHPSPLGLMGMAKRAGKGVRVSAMKEEWKRRVAGCCGAGRSHQR